MAVVMAEGQAVQDEARFSSLYEPIAHGLQVLSAESTKLPGPHTETQNIKGITSYNQKTDVNVVDLVNRFYISSAKC